MLWKPFPKGGVAPNMACELRRAKRWSHGGGLGRQAEVFLVAFLKNAQNRS